MPLTGKSPLWRFGRTKQRPTDVAFVGIDGAGKTSVSSGLKTALKSSGLHVKTIDVPHYSDLQGYAFFRWLSRKSKEIISTGARRKNRINVLVGGMMAVTPFRISKALTKGANVRLIERHPLIEGGIFEIYGTKGLANTMRQVGKAAGGFAPQLIIFMTCSPEVAAGRIAKDVTRGGKWKNAEFQHETVENLHKLQAVYERTIFSLKKTYGDKIAVVEINGMQPVEKSVQEIVQKLKELEAGAIHERINLRAKKAELGEQTVLLNEWHKMSNPERKMLLRTFRANRKNLFQKIKETLLDREYHQKLGEKLVMDGLGRWRKEGKINHEQYLTLQKDIGSEYFSDFLRHFGAHAAFTFLRGMVHIPFLGSITRSSWVATFRTKAFIDYKKKRISKEQYRKTKALHSLTVAFPISLVTGIGITAYPVSVLVAQKRGIKLFEPKLVHALLDELYSEYFRKIRLPRI